MIDCELRSIREDDLSLILSWRNSERIRKCMFSEEIIKEADHRKWFAACLNDDTRKDWIFVYEGERRGLISFTDINYRHKRCFWGFYIGSRMEGKNLGQIMAGLGLKKMFMDYGMHKIIGEVLVDNERSISFHKKLGFEQEGYFKDHILKNEKYIDVISFGLRKETWLKE